MAVFRAYERFTIEDGSNFVRFGQDADVPIKEVTVSGQSDSAPSRLTLGGLGTATIWVYRPELVTPVALTTFQCINIRLVTGSFAVISSLVAKQTLSPPVVQTDLDPVVTGTTAWRWRHRALLDFVSQKIGPLEYMSNNSNIATDDSGNTTLASHAAATGQGLIDGAFPSLWNGSHTPIVGRVYKVMVRNPNTTSITLEYFTVR